MNQVDEIAKIAGILDCTKSNVYYLLRKGCIKKTYTDDGWFVTDEAIQEYAKTRKTNKYKLQKGAAVRLLDCTCAESRWNGQIHSTMPMHLRDN